MDHFFWKMSLLSKMLGGNGHMHHFTTYEKGIPNVGDAETSTLTETFPIGAIIPTCFSFHCAPSVAVVLHIQPRSLVNSLTESREGGRGCCKT